MLRLIASTEVFQLASHSGDPGEAVSDKQQRNWAAFPLTRLRPDQMAGSISQSSSLATIDADSHIMEPPDWLFPPALGLWDGA